MSQIMGVKILVSDLLRIGKQAEPVDAFCLADADVGFRTLHILGRPVRVIERLLADHHRNEPHGLRSIPPAQRSKHTNPKRERGRLRPAAVLVPQPSLALRVSVAFGNFSISPGWCPAFRRSSALKPPKGGTPTQNHPRLLRS